MASSDREAAVVVKGVKKTPDARLESINGAVWIGTLSARRSRQNDHAMQKRMYVCE